MKSLTRSTSRKKKRFDNLSEPPYLYGLRVIEAPLDQSNTPSTCAQLIAFAIHSELPDVLRGGHCTAPAPRLRQGGAHEDVRRGQVQMHRCSLERSLANGLARFDASAAGSGEIQTNLVCRWDKKRRVGAWFPIWKVSGEGRGYPQTSRPARDFRRTYSWGVSFGRATNSGLDVGLLRCEQPWQNGIPRNADTFFYDYVRGVRIKTDLPFATVYMSCGEVRLDEVKWKGRE